MNNHFSRFVRSTLTLGALFFAAGIQAETPEEIQQRFNEQILSQPFGVEDHAKLEADINEAKKKGIPPVSTPSRYGAGLYL